MGNIILEVVKKPIVNKDSNIGCITDLKIINKGKFNERDVFSYYLEIKNKLKEDKFYKLTIEEL